MGFFVLASVCGKRRGVDAYRGVFSFEVGHEREGVEVWPCELSCHGICGGSLGKRSCGWHMGEEWMVLLKIYGLTWYLQ